MADPAKNGIFARTFWLTRIALLLVLVLVTASAARAGVDWSFSTTPDGDNVVLSDSGKSTLTFFGQPLQNHSGSKGVIGATLTSTGVESDHFKPQNYRLNMTLTDLNGGPDPHTTNLMFFGSIGGTITNGIATWDNVFDSPTSYSDVPLGDNLYTVTIGPFEGPVPNGADGSIGFTVNITSQVEPDQTPPPTQDTPEPTALGLAAAGLSSLGLGAWWRRRRARG